ncbi:uncharacterized protein LOC132932982 [Metopolophium dirhodum]|uniref:uncharacterized protein LOC132932527 n=1 Tax=Metopolophium dirhodum TaxID=44670 RepID=UPI00298F9EF9|nr:uncharacterized protein LOC132932527 [Metopolophium dirhodum]XP_060855305.1 uncharacterized protein LOC132932982 [Metopolophium dirhodum]
MAISRSSKSWNAFMLAAADDDQTINTLGPVLGVTPHFTGMTVIEPSTKADFHIWETQAKYYKYALSTLISGLVGATYRIEPEYIIEGENDYSLIYSSRVNSDMLFLGPAAFCNHSCNPNCTLKCIVKKETGVLAVKNIKANEEITVFYGQNYFENNNELFASSTHASDTDITYATPESEIDNTFFGQPSENCNHNMVVNAQKAPDSMLCDTGLDEQSPRQQIITYRTNRQRTVITIWLSMLRVKAPDSMLCDTGLDEQSPLPPDHKLQDQPSENCYHNDVVNAQKAPDSMLCDTSLDEQSPLPTDHNLQDQTSENCNHNMVVNAQIAPDSMLCDTGLDEQSPPPTDHNLQDQPSENCNHNKVVNAQEPDSTMDVLSRKKKKNCLHCSSFHRRTIEISIQQKRGRK